MNEMIAVAGRILGWSVFFFLSIRGLVAIASDFTDWTLRRQGFNCEDSRGVKHADDPLARGD